jgi:predicted DNA-binding ribbon-helix-helix protein
MRKHSLSIAGHRTSISLEAAFWDGLRELAREQGVSVAALAADIDRRRGAANLSSALRVHLLESFREKAGR